MAKLNVEIELDWLDEETKLDDAIKNEIISSLKNHVTQKATASITKDLEKFMDEKRRSIEEKITKNIDTFLGKTFQKQIEKMQIPYKEGSWNSEVKYLSMSEFVGKKYEAYLNKKVYDSDGREARSSRDAQVSINEYFVNKYLEKELVKKVSLLIQKSREDAENTVVKTLEENLKAQLSADIIKRLNIPALLINLQEKAALLEGKEGAE